MDNPSAWNKYSAEEFKTWNKSSEEEFEVRVIRTKTVDGEIVNIVVDGKAMIALRFDLSKIPPNALITDATLDFIDMDKPERQQIKIVNAWRADSSDGATEGIKPRLHIEY